MSLRRRLAPVLVIGTSLLAAAAPAHAAPTWLAPSTLNGPLPAPQSGGHPVTAVFATPAAADAAGDFFVANREWDGSHFRVALTERLHDGAVRKQTLSSATSDVDAGVALAAAPDGEVIVAWSEGGNLFVATGQAGSDLTTSPSFGPAAPSFQVAAGDGGDLAVAFAPTFGSAVSVARRPPGGALSAATSIGGSETQSFALSLTPAGETVVAWTHLTTVPTSRTTAEIRWSSAARAGAFAAPTVVPGSSGTAPTSDDTTNGGTAPSLAVDGSGNTYVLYSFGSQTQSMMIFLPFTGDLRLSVRPPGGSFDMGVSVPNTMASSQHGAITGTVWSDAAGDVLVRQVFGGLPVFVRRAGGTFSAPASATGGDGFTGLLATAMGPSGTAATIYQPSSASQTIVARAIGLDGAVGPPQQVASGEKFSSVTPGLAFDQDGDAIASWPDFDSTGSGTDEVRAGGFDAAGPRLGAVAIPATGTVGNPLGFSATATDTWSNPVSIAWDFGDGATASGGQVSHAFGAGGQWRVTVTATDAVGNTSSATGTVSIPAGGPGGAGGGGGGGAAADRTAPTVRSLAVSPSRFAVGAATTVLSRAKRKRAHRGTTISFKLSEAADGAFTITGKKPKRGKAKRFSIKLRGLKKGKLKLAFSGRVGGKALKPGSYTLTVVATDKAGNHSKPARARFVVVRR